MKQTVCILYPNLIVVHLDATVLAVVCKLKQHRQA
jgi:hypothetical protein